MRLNGRLGVCYGSQDPQMSDNEDRKPSEGEVVQNSRVDTLYTHAFNEGTASEGRFFNIVTLDDGSQRLEMELTPRIRITFIFIKERNEISSVTIQKHRFNKRWGWRPDKKEEVRLTPITFGKVVSLMRFLSELDFAGIHERRIKLAEDTLPKIDAQTRRKILTLLAQKDGVAIIEELLRDNILSTKDIVNTGYRKAQLGIFERLLKEDGFVEAYKAEHDIRHPGAEAAWQYYFERNSWVFGYGLNYIWCTNLPDHQLEQVVSGFDFNAPGKRVDALLRSTAYLSQFVLVEIKTPTARLVGKSARPGVWSASSDVVDGIAQIQKTVSDFKQKYFEKAALVDDKGDPLGVDVFNFSPKSYLLIGDLREFASEHGVNHHKYSSFQFFRGSMRDPEIITFDELHARGKAIVEHADKT